jgi:signal transduction histidine kinase
VIHHLLVAPPTEEDLAGRLEDLAGSFDAQAAGLGTLVDGLPVRKIRAARGHFDQAPVWPWEQRVDLVGAILDLPTTFAIPLPGSGQLVAVSEFPVGLRWFLWLDDAPDRVWGPPEQATLLMAVHALAQALGPVAGQAVGRRRRQRRLQDLAAVTGRLAHDLGNVFTGVVGFAELALSQVPPRTAAYRYVNETYRIAQNGVRTIQRLGLFSRRPPACRQQADLAAALAEERARVQLAWAPDVILKIDLPGSLPAVALDHGSLRHVLGQILDNARDAITGAGRVKVSVRPSCLTEADCLTFLGRPFPGDCLEVTVTDTGGGVPDDLADHFLEDVFFSTRAGHRGLGLAAVFGTLWAHDGGFRLEAAAGGGTTVRLALPPAGSRSLADRINRTTSPCLSGPSAPEPPSPPLAAVAPTMPEPGPI